MTINTSYDIQSGKLNRLIIKNRELQTKLYHFNSLLQTTSDASAVLDDDLNLAKMAHELNQPLATIVTYAQNYLMKHPDIQQSPDMQNILEKILLQAEHTDQLIQSARTIVNNEDFCYQEHGLLFPYPYKEIGVPRTKIKKICIVDDNRAVCDSLKFLFQSTFNIDVAMYHNALDFLQDYRPDWQGCIIVDYFMPVLNGIDLIKKLKKRNNSMGIIIMSGNSSMDMIERAKAAGAKAFVTKPFKIDHFLSEVKTILDTQPSQDGSALIEHEESILAPA